MKRQFVRIAKAYCRGEHCLQVSAKKERRKISTGFNKKIEEGFDPFGSNLKCYN